MVARRTPKLRPDARLVRAEHLRLDLEPARTRVSAGDRSADAGPLTLAILDAFARPATVQEVVHALAPRAGSAMGWATLVQTITALHDMGALRAEGDARAAGPPGHRPSRAPTLHVSLLADRVRTESFLEAIRRTVRPGDVVVDIGTGSGVLAMAAAAAGARKVYAIEGGPVAEATERVVADNGLSGRIQVVRGWSHEVTLPERGDVLVTETIGHDPFAEGVLGIVRDARRRLLKRGARLLPRGVRVYAVPVALPPAQRARRVFTAGAVRRWREWYGFDFAALHRAAREDPPVQILLSRREAGRLRALTPPACVAAADFGRADSAKALVARVRATREGKAGAIVSYFELDVGGGVRIVTDPWRPGGVTNWTCPAWILDPPLEVRRGQALALSAAVDRFEARPTVIEP